MIVIECFLDLEETKVTDDNVIKLVNVRNLGLQNTKLTNKCINDLTEYFDRDRQQNPN